jgi:hypothetical protein
VVILIDIHSDCTQVYTDPRTGHKKVTKRLGGAYPGQKTSHSSPYIPPASAFGKDGQATAHFIAHGGGNALTLVQSDGSTAPEVGGTQPEFIQGGEKRRNRLDRLRFRLLHGYFHQLGLTLLFPHLLFSYTSRRSCSWTDDPRSSPRRTAQRHCCPSQYEGGLDLHGRIRCPGSNHGLSCIQQPYTSGTFFTGLECS